jgi:hypothetical protein
MPELEIDIRAQNDVTKPVGEACNADGTLKEANKIVWLNSPSDENPSSFPKRAHTPESDLQDLQQRNPKKVRVSHQLFHQKLIPKNSSVG